MRQLILLSWLQDGLVDPCLLGQARRSGPAGNPRPIDPTLLRTVHRSSAWVGRPSSRCRRNVELRNWDTDEPSERGIDGIERMRLVRDDIDARVQALLVELASTAAPLNS